MTDFSGPCGPPSDLSSRSCRAVFEWARSGAPLPRAARDEIRALARKAGARDPLSPELRAVPSVRYVELWQPWEPPKWYPEGFQMVLPLRRPE